MTLSDFKELCNEAYDLYEKIRGYKNEMKEIQIRLDQKHAKIIEQMKETEQTQFAGNGFKAICVTKMTVKMPKDPEDKKLFFNHLKTEGIFDEMITVHSQRLNSYYNECFDQSIEEKNIEFKIPGLEPPTAFEHIRYRKNN